MDELVEPGVLVVVILDLGGPEPLLSCSMRVSVFPGLYVVFVSDDSNVMTSTASAPLAMKRLSSCLLSHVLVGDATCMLRRLFLDRFVSSSVIPNSRVERQPKSSNEANTTKREYGLLEKRASLNAA